MPTRASAAVTDAAAHLPHGVLAYSLGTGLAALAAVLCGLGSYLQHRGATDSVSGGSLRLRRLFTRRTWLTGQAALVAGTALQIAALGVAPVSIVQPVLACGLVVALAARAVQDRRFPPRVEVAGAGLTVLGLAVFLVAARPGIGRHEHAPGPLLCLLVLGVSAALALIGLALRRPTAGAVVLGGSAGVALGVAAVLVSAALRLLEQRGLGAALVSAALWSAVACAVLAAWATQQAFARGGLALTLPTLTVVDPVAAVFAARVLLGEHLASSHAAVWMSAGAVAAVGVVLCARADGVRAPVDR